MTKRSKKAVKKTKKVNKKQSQKAENNHRQFVEEYLANGRNGTRAYLKVYPNVTELSARVLSPRLFAKVSVQEYLTNREAELLSDLNITTQRVLQEAARLAFVDIRKLYYENGNLKAPQDMDDDTAAALASIETEELFAGHGEERVRVGTAKKVKVFDKSGSVERLMKYLSMFKDKGDAPTLPSPAPVNVTVNISPDEAYRRMLDGPAKR